MKKITVSDVSFSYDQEQDALSHVSFDIEEGTYTTIIGHNGSGKSTIAKLLVGLMKADGGTCLLYTSWMPQDIYLKNVRA